MLKKFIKAPIERLVRRIVREELSNRFVREFKRSISESSVKRALSSHLLKNRPLQEVLKSRLDSLELESSLFGEAPPHEDRMQLLGTAIREAQKLPQNGLWCEFGVFAGKTLNHIALQVPERTVYGFDSFDKLPEVWVRGRYVQSTGGKLDISNGLPAVKANVRLVKGWFNETLPSFIKEHPEPAVFVHIDSDLYSSAKCVLDHLNFADGAVIVFDEYYNYPAWRTGEYKAFQEFLSKKSLRADCIGFCPALSQAAFRLSAASG